MLAAILTTVLFALSSVCAYRTTRALGSSTANFLRLCLATLFLALWAHTAGYGLGGGALPWFMLSGCVGFGLGDLALYQALPRLGPRLTALMVQCLAAPLATAAEWIWLGTPLTGSQLLSSGVILAGVALALSPKEQLHIPRAALVSGIALGVLAALGQAGGAVLSRRAYQVLAAGGAAIDGGTAAYQRILGGVLVAGLPFMGIWRSTDRGAGWRLDDGGALRGAPRGLGAGGAKYAVWPWVLANSLVGPVLGVACYQWALATTPSGIVLPIVATTPLVVIPFAFCMDGDRPGPRAWLGAVLAVAGAAGLTLRGE